MPAAASAAKSLQSCPTLCDPIDGSPPGSPSLVGTRTSLGQEHWSGLPFPSPMHETEQWKWSCSVVSNSHDPMECSLPGSSAYGIFQARVLEWVAIAFSIFHAYSFSNLESVESSSFLPTRSQGFSYQADFGCWQGSSVTGTITPQICLDFSELESILILS